MFQLIVAVIAIALVIALTLASIFYGGEAFTRSSLKANVAAMVNQAQQISGAHTLYKTDFAVDADNISWLVTEKYLAEEPIAPKIVAQEDTDGDNVADAPVKWVYEPDNNRVYIQLGADAQETCDAVKTNGAGFCSDGSATAVKGNAGVTHYQFPL